MSGDEKVIDRKLSTLSDRFGLRGRARATPNIPAKSKASPGLTSKRTFSPNIVTRNIKKEETPDKAHPLFKDKRGRGRGQRGRGRGRGRGDNIIQSTGVFSQGVFAQPTLAKALGGDFSYGGAGGGGGGGGNSGSSKISLKTDKLEDDGECIESGRVLEMMDDEGKLEIEEMKGGNLVPITLPLASKLAQNFKQDDYKKESHDDDDTKPYIAKSAIKQLKAPPPIELAELFKEDAPDGQLLFLQFPDTLPIKPISSEDEPIKEEPGVGNTEKTNKNTINEQDIEEHLKKFTFCNVSEGFIGKLCVHKSGKVKMHLGNVSLDLSLGTPCGFLQDLISVQTDREPAEMISLGHVNHRLIAIPDYKGLLGSVGT